MIHLIIGIGLEREVNWQPLLSCIDCRPRNATWAINNHCNKRSLSIFSWGWDCERLTNDNANIWNSFSASKTADPAATVWAICSLYHLIHSNWNPIEFLHYSTEKQYFSLSHEKAFILFVKNVGSKVVQKWRIVVESLKNGSKIIFVSIDRTNQTNPGC